MKLTTTATTTTATAARRGRKANQSRPAAREKLEASTYVEGLTGLFRAIRIAGVTPAEMGICKSAILKPIMPANLNQLQLEQVLGIVAGGREG